MNSACVIAIDVGGTAIKAGLVDGRGRLMASRGTPTDQSGGADGVIAQVVSICAELESTAMDGGSRPVAVGVGALGLIDDEAGVAVLSANLGWRDVPMRALLESKIEMPIALGHDVRAGGLAEAVLGAGRGVGDHLFLAIGTGVAGAIMTGGKPYLGTGHAGEIGQIVSEPDGAPCGCGGRGCLETVASGRAIARRYAERSGERVSAEEVAKRSAAGDPRAATVWGEAVDAMASALATYVSLFAPERIVVGGGLAASGDHLLSALRTRLAHRLSFQHMPSLVPAELGEQAGCLGAGLLAWDLLDRPVLP